jgi:SAM-dependent methyltransferase
MGSYSRIAGVALPFAVLTAGALAFLQLRPPKAADRTAQAFEGIYRDRTWGANEQGAGTSGFGSTLDSTRLFRAFLQDFLADHHIHSVVDAGCGDWEFTHAIDWAGIDYKGYDIVESVIAADKAKYEAPNIHFFTANVVTTDLPAADLLLVKHVLQHLSNAEVAQVLAQMPKYEHVLLVDSVGAITLSGDNKDITAGQFRLFDPTRPPFSVPGVKLLTYFDGGNMQQVVYLGRHVNARIVSPTP